MFELPKISFEFGDFEPVIDIRTMEIHYSKHHQAYVDNLNKMVSGSEDQWIKGASVEEILQNTTKIPEPIRQGVINNAGGHWNHTFWWEQLQKPTEMNEPGGSLRAEIDRVFGSFDIFKEQFSKVALSRFGSGWAWLLMKKDGGLAVESSVNQDCPIMQGKKPILGLDVWEHAYYLNYQNRRADYVTAFWQIIDWEVVGKRM